MMISVIIPTYNRPQVLLQALQSLQKQTLNNFEIIVVDNAADRVVEKMVKKFNATARMPARYIPEPNLGVHNARHAGARVARGEILAFTDDDATFDPGWLQSYAEACSEHPEMAAAGGPVRPAWEVSPPEWLLEFMGDKRVFPILSLMEPYDEFRLDSRGFFYGVNMAIRRNVLFEVGGFNPEAFGEIWLGDGETGLNRKLWRRGMLIGYVPRAIVYHHIPPERMTVGYFLRRMANEGACDAYARYHHGIPSRLILIRDIAVVCRRKMKTWIKAAILHRRRTPSCLQIRLDAARSLSRVQYTWRLLYDTRFRNFVEKKDWLEFSG